MPAEISPFVDVALSWSRPRGGQTAVLRREADDAGWEELARVDGTEYTVRGVHPERAHVFAAAAVLEDGSLDAEDSWETIRVVPLGDPGSPSLPAAPTGFAAAQDGPNLNLRWDPPGDDVTATYEIRAGTTWEDGRLVADGLKASPYAWAWWASGAITLHLKAIDRFGRASRIAVALTVTIAALETHVTQATADEGGGGWTGTKTHMETDAGALRLTRLPQHFGAMTAPFGSYAGVPCFSRYWHEGTYETAAVDVGAVEPQRLEVDLGQTQPTDANLPFGAVRRPALGARRRRDGTTVPIGTRGHSSRNSWRNTPLLPVDVNVEVDTSQTSGGAWDGWRPFVPGTYGFRRVRLRVTVRGDGLRYVRLPTLKIRRRKFNLKDEGFVALPGGASVQVTFAAAFTVPPEVTTGIVGPLAANGVKVLVTARTKTTCHLEAFDGAGTSIAADVSWHAMAV